MVKNCVSRASNTRMWGFPRSDELNEGELRVGVTPNGWGPITWAPMKGASRSVKPRIDNKLHQPTWNPNP
ncbi:MAG: hypothetical protein QW596_02920 [Sulfolobales archaeon]